MILTKTQDRPYDAVEYDPAWMRRYEMEAAAVRGIFGSSLKQLEHVGPTSVPGMLAAPVIDLLAVVDDMSIERNIMKQLAMLGYIDKGDYFDNGSRFLSKMRMMNLYIFPHGHAEAAAQLRLRDYLRAQPVDVERYNRGEIGFDDIAALCPILSV